jgi:hypothetical protein
MSRRNRNHRLVKIHRSYSVEEAARVLDVHKNTIRDWVRRGLPTVDQQRPTLILGRDLAEFLVRRRRSRKRPCAPGQIYCVRCRCPRSPAGDMADYLPLTATTGNLVGLCPTCNALMYRRVSASKLDSVRGYLEVCLPLAVQHIGESDQPSVNRDFAQE